MPGCVDIFEIAAKCSCPTGYRFPKRCALLIRNIICTLLRFVMRFDATTAP